MIVISLLIGQQLPTGVRNWRFIFIVGFLNSAVPFFLISWGQQFIGSAESALLVAMGTDVVKLFDTPQLSGILHFQTLFFIIVRADITQRRM